MTQIVYIVESTVLGAAVSYHEAEYTWLSVHSSREAADAAVQKYLQDADLGGDESMYSVTEVTLDHVFGE